jgi:arginine repressor
MSRAASKDSVHMLIDALYKRKKSCREIAQLLRAQGIQVSKSTVNRHVQLANVSKQSASKAVRKPGKLGGNRLHQRIITLVRFHKQRHITDIHRRLRQGGFDVSYATVWRKVHSMQELSLVHPRVSPDLKPQHIKQRLEWAIIARQQQFDWDAAFLADEKTWYVNGPVFRSTQLHHVLDPWPTVTRSVPRCNPVHVWGCISRDVVVCD